MKSQYMNSNVCPTYAKLRSALVDSPYGDQIALSMDKQIHKLLSAKDIENLTAQQITQIVRIKQANPKIPAKSLFNAIVNRNAEAVLDQDKSNTTNKLVNPNAQGKPLPEPSQYETKQEYLKRLVDMGLSLAAATTAANEVFGPRNDMVGGKIRKKFMNRTNGRPNQPMVPKQSNTEAGRKLLLNDIDKMYPNITRESAKIIADSFQHRDIDTSNIKKTITPAQANSRQIYAASVEDQEIPAYLRIQEYQKGHYMPLAERNSTNNAESQSIIDQHKAGKYTPQSDNLKSASVQTDKLSEMPFIVTNKNIVERGIFEYANQEKQKEIAKKTAHIKQASNTNKTEVPAWYTLHQYYNKGGVGN
jgi:hypothetical protein